MDIPKFTAYAKAQNRAPRFESAIKTLEDGFSNKHIWNVDYEEAKSTVSRLAEGAMDKAAEPYNEHIRATGNTGYSHQSDWGDKDARWMTIYSPQFMNVPGAIKKLEKYESTEDPTFSDFINMLREIAQVAELFKAVKPFIEKGRKPSENPVEKDVTNTGICPVCMKRQKLTFNGSLVAHGYTIPRGWGGRNGMCTGMGYKAWELAPEGAIAFKEGLVGYLESENKTLANLQASKYPELHEKVQVRKGFGEFVDEVRTYAKGTPEYEKVRTSAIYSTESNIRHLTSDIQNLSLRIQNWKAQPLQFGGAETQERWKSRILNKKEGN